MACGSGQLALVAARRGARVTGVDIAANSIRAARGRAQAEGLPIQFDEGDAEALPYASASFDVVASLFGAMFAPRPDLVAQELIRVCRPGGTIAMANWTRSGFIGQMFALVSRFIAPPGMPALVLWGDSDRVMPGEGHLDLDRYLELLSGTGYKRWLSLELFREDLWAQDPLEVARVGLEKMRAVAEG